MSVGKCSGELICLLGKPSGTVKEVKEEGEVKIKSARNNTIKKNASPDNPVGLPALFGSILMFRLWKLSDLATTS